MEEALKKLEDFNSQFLSTNDFFLRYVDTTLSCIDTTLFLTV